MNRFVAQWNAFWFPQTTAVRLAVCRIVMVAAQLLFFLPSQENNLRMAEANSSFSQPQAIIGWLSGVVSQDILRSPQLLTWLYYSCFVSGVMALVGLLTRPAAFVFAAANSYLVLHQYSYGNKHHPEAIFCLFLMLLAFSPSGRCLSVDAWLFGRRNPKAWGVSAVTDNALWPLRVVQVVLALAYLCAGLCKLLHPEGGLDWLNGYTLQHYLLQDGVRWDRPLGVWMAQQHYLCIVMGAGAVLLELGFFVAIFSKRIMPFLLIGGAAMHLSIYVLQAAPFFQFIFLYLVFIDVEHLLKRPAAATLGQA